jgi:hypothetical protein
MEKNLKQALEKLALSFDEQVYENVFSTKNNKTLSETLSHRRYRSLKSATERNYSNYLNMPLGSFILLLKNNEDDFYQRFLNKYGDAVYSQFWLANSHDFMKKGVYFYMLNDEIVYVGRCKDNMKKRINSGYGKVAPKNCFKDGQSTNCRLNSLITKEKSRVSLQLYALQDDVEIEELEKLLIHDLNPIWNIQK